MCEPILSFTIQGDSEGYITFTCPYCDSDFKLQAGEYQSEEEPCSELFCPYCGLSKEKTEFYSKDVIEKVSQLATNFLFEKLNKAAPKMAGSINHQQVFIKMSFKPLEKVNVRELKEKETMETEFQCGVCDHHAKVLYCAGASKIFCPYCGVDI